MPVTDEQRAALIAEAEKRGIDPAKLIAAADKSRQSTSESGKSKSPPTDEAPPNLYMYHLPFLTVNEVRVRWLKLEQVAGGEQYAGEWAAQRGVAAAKPDEPDE